MKTKAPEKMFGTTKGFHDFTTFSVFVVTPGAILTPRVRGTKRPRVAPIRKPTLRFQLPGWQRTPFLYIGKTTVNEAIRHAKLSQEETSEDEEREWGVQTRRAFNQWAGENEE